MLSGLTGIKKGRPVRDGLFCCHGSCAAAAPRAVWLRCTLPRVAPCAWRLARGALRVAPSVHEGVEPAAVETLIWITIHGSQDIKEGLLDVLIAQILFQEGK